MKSAGLKGTVSIELVHEAIHAAALRNMDISSVLESAKIDRELLNAPRARISAAAYSQMWVALADLNGQWIDRFHDRNGLKYIV